MAGCLQRMCLVLSRASVLCSKPTITATQYRFIRKEPDIQQGVRHSQRAPRHRDGLDGEDELEDVEDKIRTVIKKEVMRQKTLKYHIVKRKMTPRGPIERKLTWDAMEEIRHLKQEQPEEWTVEHLAEGFSVNKDTILRVLRSKFAPSPERKAKQDIKVMAKLKQQVLLSGPREHQKKTGLTSGPKLSSSLSSSSVSSALIPVDHQSLMLENEQNPVALCVVAKHSFLQVTELNDGPQEKMQQSTESAVVEEEEEEDSWNGHILSEEDIEELMKVKPTPVVKEGNEIYDIEGNFLYKI